MNYPRRLTPLLALILLLLAGGCGSRQAVAPPPADPTTRAASWPISTEAFRQLSAEEQDARREAAAEHLETFREIEHAMRSRHFWSGRSLRPLYLGVGVVMCLDNLSRALEIDPDNATAWIEHAEYSIKLGERETARRCFNQALIALDSRTDEEAIPPRNRIARAQAWLCYDLGFWEEGSAWIEEVKTIEPLDHEMQLCRGLLLAGAGRLVEANLAAQNLAPVTYRVYSHPTPTSTIGFGFEGYSGRMKRNSRFCENWIRARVRVARGEYDLARQALGEVFWYRFGTPYPDRYWNDVGLIHELTGDNHNAGVAYGIAFLNLPDRFYVPGSGFSTGTTILDKPSLRVPVFSSFANQYLAGSRFAFAAQAVRECLTESDADRKGALAGTALDHLDTCIRANIWPGRAWALRGRVLFARGDYDDADRDLLLGHEMLAANDLVDPMTSFLIGTVRMNREEPGLALPWFYEATGADRTLAGAWRSLSVALLQTGEPTLGREAVDKAIELQPENLGGHFNRGLLNMQEGRWEDALADLTRAVNLAPDNRQVEELYAKAMEGQQNAEIAAAYAREAVDPADLATSMPLATEPTADDVTAMMRRAATLLRETRGADRPQKDVVPVESLDEADFLVILSVLEEAWAAEPMPDVRHDLALAYLLSNQPDKTLAILLPDWGGDLSPREMRLVIEADRALGRSEHALEAVETLLDDDEVLVDPSYWSLVGTVLFETDNQSAAYTAFAYVEHFFSAMINAEGSFDRSGGTAATVTRYTDMNAGHYLLSAEAYNARRKAIMANRSTESATKTKR